MHYYQFNIGDYASHTRHLTPIEDLAYRRLLDQYYLHERPLNSGCASVARQIGLSEYQNEVEAVLRDFFTLTDVGWVSKRADEEINRYHGRLEQASKAGKASAAKRTFNARSTDVQPTNNQEPITNNHKPIKTPSAVNAIAFDGTTWLNTDKHLSLWQKAYPALDLKTELSKAAAWLVANPKNTKSNYARFLTNWFARAQDRAPTTNSPPAKMNNADKYLNSWGTDQKGLTNERDITGIAERLD